jgi:PAS domain S-box-containing protein
MFVDTTDIVKALECDEVIPCYQPLVELRTGKVAGFEVLARWNSPTLGLVLPQNFISLAEQSGLISQLTNNVLRKAFTEATALPEPVYLSVNISPNQLQSSSLATQIRDAAENARYPLNHLTIEITETALLGNLGRSQKTASLLKAMGCRLALDDFGTGYSSLGHLQALPFDEVKIDRGFVEDMAQSRDSRKIVAAIIGLGHSLGLTTVAEGVETEEQAEILLWLGCARGQGWLYGRPTTAEAIRGILASPPRRVSAELSSHGDGRAVSSMEALGQLQAIYDGAPVGLCFLDSNLRHISVNRKLAENNGVSVEAHLGKTVKEIAPDLYPAIEPYLLRALQGEAMNDLEVSRPSTRPGEAGRTSLISYQPARDETDAVIGVSVAVVDITARKRTEEALHVSEAEHRQMVEFHPQIPWIMDAEGNNLDVDSRWIQGAGPRKGQARNFGWIEALHLDDADSTLKAVRGAMVSCKPIDVQYRVRGVDGQWRWMRSRGSPRFSLSGDILRWYGCVEDIDDVKRLEEALRVSQAQLRTLYEALRMPIKAAETAVATLMLPAA